MKKNTSTPSKNISRLCERLASDFEDWNKIPTVEDNNDGKKEREHLYNEIKKKMENLSD